MKLTDKLDIFYSLMIALQISDDADSRLILVYICEITIDISY
jgi:hypothetical protein